MSAQDPINQIGKPSRNPEFEVDELSDTWERSAQGVTVNFEADISFSQFIDEINIVPDQDPTDGPNSTMDVTLRADYEATGLATRSGLTDEFPDNYSVDFRVTTSRLDRMVSQINGKLGETIGEFIQLPPGSSIPSLRGGISQLENYPSISLEPVIGETDVNGEEVDYTQIVLPTLSDTPEGVQSLRDFVSELPPVEFTLISSVTPSGILSNLTGGGVTTAIDETPEFTFEVPAGNFFDFVEVERGSILNCLDANSNLLNEVGDYSGTVGGFRSGMESAIGGLEDLQSDVVGLTDDISSVGDLSSEMRQVREQGKTEQINPESLTGVSIGESELSQANSIVSTAESRVQEAREQLQNVDEKREEFRNKTSQIRNNVTEGCLAEILREVFGDSYQQLQGYFGTSGFRSSLTDLAGGLLGSQPTAEFEGTTYQSQRRTLTTLIDRFESLIEASGGGVEAEFDSGCVPERDVSDNLYSKVTGVEETVRNLNDNERQDVIDRVRDDLESTRSDVESQLEQGNPCRRTLMNRLDGAEETLDNSVSTDCGASNPTVESAVSEYESTIRSLPETINPDRQQTLLDRADSITEDIDRRVGQECASAFKSRLENARASIEGRDTIDLGEAPCSERYSSINQKITELELEISSISRVDVTPEGQITSSETDFGSVDEVLNRISNLTSEVASTVDDDDIDCSREFTDRLDAVANDAEQLLIGIRVNQEALEEVEQRREEIIAEVRGRIESRRERGEAPDPNS